MPLYENVFIARQDVSATQVDALTDQFAGLIKEHGGEVTKKEYWGLRNLSFRIKKNRKGHYILFNIEAPSEAVQEMERKMRLSEDVIRYLTVRVTELEADQSIVLRSKGSREERGRGGRRFGGFDRGGPRSGPRGPRADAEPPKKEADERPKKEGAEQPKKEPDEQPKKADAEQPKKEADEQPKKADAEQPKKEPDEQPKKADDEQPKKADAEVETSVETEAAAKEGAEE